MYLVEQYSKKHFGGKIPAKKDVTAVLEKKLDSPCGELGSTTTSRSKQKRNREDNPAKSALEVRGIKFPRQCSQDCRAETEKVSKPSSILYTAPKDEKEEAEQLTIVKRESLRHESSNSLMLSLFLKMIGTAVTLLALYLDIQHRAIHFITMKWPE